MNIWSIKVAPKPYLIVWKALFQLIYSPFLWSSNSPQSSDVLNISLSDIMRMRHSVWKRYCEISACRIVKISPVSCLGDRDLEAKSSWFRLLPGLIQGVPLRVGIRGPVRPRTWMNTASHREDIPNNCHLKSFLSTCLCIEKNQNLWEKMENDFEP
jgi:hypothetical protein